MSEESMVICAGRLIISVDISNIVLTNNSPLMYGGHLRNGIRIHFSTIFHMGVVDKAFKG